MDHGHGRVLVVGSVNRDVVLRVPHLPAPGETVLGHEVTLGLGGKGANQAVAAARAGAAVRLLASVGDDLHGPALRAEVEQFGVDTSLVAEVDGPSGQAYVRVDDGGQNSIVVVPGANAATTAARVDAAREQLAASDVVVVQGEVPAAALVRAVELAAEVGTTCVVNLAPFVSIDAAVLADVAVLVVNETEAGQLLDEAPPGDDAAAEAAVARLATRTGAVVLSRGARGATLAPAGGGRPRHVPAPEAPRVVDTTGAGDALVGVLAAALAAGRDLPTAVRAAVAGATRSVGAAGAAASYPVFDLGPTEAR